jgi:hypothetical protein
MIATARFLRFTRRGAPQDGPVAQWSEPAAHNGLVAGSSPARPTSHPPTLWRFQLSTVLARATRGCRPSPAKFSLPEGGLRLSGPNYPPCLWGRLLRFPSRLSTPPPETRFERVGAVRSNASGDFCRGSPSRPPVRRGRARRTVAHFVEGTPLAECRGANACGQVGEVFRPAAADRGRAIDRRSAAGDP